MGELMGGVRACEGADHGAEAPSMKVLAGRGWHWVVVVVVSVVVVVVGGGRLGRLDRRGRSTRGRGRGRGRETRRGVRFAGPPQQVEAEVEARGGQCREVGVVGGGEGGPRGGYGGGGGGVLGGAGGVPGPWGGASGRGR